MGGCKLCTVSVLLGVLISILTFSFRVSKPGTLAEQWDRVSWKEFWKLAHEAPQAGIHVQSKALFSCPLGQIDIQSLVR
jgi:hypothetical protein